MLDRTRLAKMHVIPDAQGALGLGGVRATSKPDGASKVLHREGLEPLPLRLLDRECERVALGPERRVDLPVQGAQQQVALAA